MEPKIESASIREDPCVQRLVRGRRILADVVGVDGRRSGTLGTMRHFGTNLDFCGLVEIEPFGFVRL